MGVMTLANTGARKYPLIAGFDYFCQIIIGHKKWRRVFAPPGNLCVIQAVGSRQFIVVILRNVMLGRP